MVMNPPANVGDARDVGSIPGLGRSPGVGNSNPLQYFLPGKLHGQMTLAGYSSTGFAKCQTRLNMHMHTLRVINHPIILFLQEFFFIISVCFSMKDFVGFL